MLKDSESRLIIAAIIGIMFIGFLYGDINLIRNYAALTGVATLAIVMIMRVAAKKQGIIISNELRIEMIKTGILSANAIAYITIIIQMIKATK